MKELILFTFTLMLLSSCTGVKSSVTNNANNMSEPRHIRFRDMPRPKQVAINRVNKLEQYNTVEKTPDIFFESTSRIRSGLVADNSKLYFGNNDCQFFAINIANGRRIWTYTTDDVVLVKPIIIDGKIIFNAGDNLYILNNEDGAEIHKIKHPISSRSARDRWTFNEAHAVFNDGVVYYSALNGDIIAVDINTGNVIRIFTPEKAGFLSSGINFYNGNLYFVDYTGSLCCLNIESWSIKFKTEIRDRVFAPMYIENGKLYLGGRESVMYCIDANNGDVIWSSYSYIRDTWFSGGSVYLGDNLYTGTSDERTVNVYNKNTGDFVRSYPTRLNVYLPPLAYGEHLIITATDVYSLKESYILAFDTINNTLRWQAKLNYAVLSLPVICQNVLYFGSELGKIYKIQLD